MTRKETERRGRMKKIRKQKKNKQKNERQTKSFASLAKSLFETRVHRETRVSDIKTYDDYVNIHEEMKM